MCFFCGQQNGILAWLRLLYSSEIFATTPKIIKSKSKSYVGEEGAQKLKQMIAQSSSSAQELPYDLRCLSSLKCPFNILGCLSPSSSQCFTGSCSKTMGLKLLSHTVFPPNYVLIQLGELLRLYGSGSQGRVWHHFSLYKCSRLEHGLGTWLKQGLVLFLHTTNTICSYNNDYQDSKQHF